MNEINIFRKTSRTLKITVTNKATGAAYPISDYTTYFTMKSKTDNSTADTSAQIAKSVTSLPGSNTAHIILTTADTDIGSGAFVYDVVLNDGSSRFVIVKSDLNINDTVTNR